MTGRVRRPFEAGTSFAPRKPDVARCPLARGSRWFGWNVGRGARAQDARARRIDLAARRIDPAARTIVCQPAGRIFLPRASETLLRDYLSSREGSLTMPADGLRRVLPVGFSVAADAMTPRMIFEWAASSMTLSSGLCGLVLALGESELFNFCRSFPCQNFVPVPRDRDRCRFRLRCSGRLLRIKYRVPVRPILWPRRWLRPR